MPISTRGGHRGSIAVAVTLYSVCAAAIITGAILHETFKSTEALVAVTPTPGDRLLTFAWSR